MDFFNCRIYNLTERIFFSTYTITARAAFGKKNKDQEEFISIVMEATKIGSGFDLADVFPSFSFLDPLIFGTRAKLEKLRQKSERIVDNILEEHRKKKPTTKSGQSETVTEDLVDVLLKFHNRDLGFSLTTDNLKAIIFVSTHQPMLRFIHIIYTPVRNIYLFYKLLNQLGFNKLINIYIHAYRFKFLCLNRQLAVFKFKVGIFISIM